MEKQFLVYKSSAGSGKTFTLVKEFLKLCLAKKDHNYFSKILAITFTNKATQEMKNRIVEELQLLADKSAKSEMRTIFMRELAMSEDELCEKAEKILSAILHNYGDFSVSTIDSFSYRIIKTFARDIGLPMNFQLEIDEKRILEESVNALIETVGGDAELTKSLISFILFRVQEESSWRIEEDLKQFARNLTKDSNAPFLNALKKNSVEDFNNLKKHLSKIITNTEYQFEELKNKGNNLILNCGADVKSFYYGARGIANYFNKIVLLKPDTFELNSYMVKTIEENYWYKETIILAEQSAIDSIKSSVIDLINKLEQFKNKELKIYIAALSIRNKLYSLSLIKDIDKRIEDYKKEERVLPISDFNKKIAQFVLEEPVPFIYHRIGERYKHLMIDEFQDTSVLQFVNLLPLIENALSEGHKNMIVGDAKQAIYRFRGGEVRQLAAMPNYMHANFENNSFVKQRMQVLKSQYQPINLETNYRSTEAVVDFNNTFFNYLKQREDLFAEDVRTIFDEVEQKVREDKKNQGLVELRFLNNGKDEFHLEHILEIINTAVEDHNYSYSDIGILCRNNIQAVNVANFLKDEEIPLVSSEALLIKNIPQVKFLVNLSIWLNDFQNIKAIKDIISFLINKKGWDDKMDVYFKKYLCVDSKGNPQADLREFFFELGYTINVETLELLPLHLLFEEFIRTFELDKEFDIYIQSFQEEVLTFSQKEGNNLNAFIDWWEEFQDKLALDLPEGTNAIEILTIHKSKGLAFPIVILPFLKKVALPKPKDIWVSLPEELKGESEVSYALIKENKNLDFSLFKTTYQEEVNKRHMDDLNVLYVALTRAADSLYLIAEPFSAKHLESVAESNLLKSFLDFNNLTLNQGEDYEYYRWGNAKTKPLIPEKLEEDKIHLKYHSLPWTAKLAISKKGRGNWLVKAENNQRDYGNLMHDILADIKTEEDIETVLNQKHLKGEIKPEELSYLSSKLKAITGHLELKEYFSKHIESKREVPLITSSGEIVRPDRLVIFKDKWVVIDYKTGEKNESHEIQVKNYIHALSEITDLPIEGLIIYTENLELLKVA